jgi:MFS family permease
MLALSAVPNIAIAYGVVAVVSGASVAYMTAAVALAQLRTAPHMIGRVLALQTVLIAGTTPIGAPILGVISDAIGGRAPMFIGAIGAFAAAFVFVAMRRLHLNHDHLENDVLSTTSRNGVPHWKHPCPRSRPSAPRSS